MPTELPGSEKSSVPPPADSNKAVPQDPESVDRQQEPPDWLEAWWHYTDQTPPPLLEHEQAILHTALWLISQGVPVFPCGLNKIPCVPGFPGPRWAATTSTQPVCTWFGRLGRFRGYMIAIPTGAESGVVVIDVDIGGGKDGPGFLRAIELRLGPLPRTRRHETPSGGYQLHFTAPSGVKIKNIAGKIGNFDTPGLDVRGDGGMAIMPPSRRYDGKAYVSDGAPFAELPLAWVHALKQPEEPDRPPPQVRHVVPTSGDADARYGAAALARHIKNLSETPDGQRNDQLNKSSFSLGQLVPHYLNEATVVAELEAAACACGLNKDRGGLKAIRKTIRSGLTRGMARPYDRRDSPNATHARELEAAARFWGSRP